MAGVELLLLPQLTPEFFCSRQIFSGIFCRPTKNLNRSTAKFIENTRAISYEYGSYGRMKGVIINV